MTIVNIGKGIELNVDTSKLNDAVMAHVTYIGLRNILMDSHASHTRESDGDQMVPNSRATAEKKLAAMYAGEVRTVAARSGDPVRTEALRLATMAIHAAIRQKGRKVADVDAKAIRAKAQSIMDKYLDKARANLEAAKADGLKDELGDLIDSMV